MESTPTGGPAQDEEWREITETCKAVPYASYLPLFTRSPFIREISRTVAYLSLSVPVSTFVSRSHFRTSEYTRRFCSFGSNVSSLLLAQCFPPLRVSTFFWTLSTRAYTTNNARTFFFSPFVHISSPPPHNEHNWAHIFTFRNGIRVYS